MKLVIVESPAKAKTIGRYLGKGYTVKATMGHVKDLPKSSLGVAVDDNYTPDYQVLRGKGKVLAELKKSKPAQDRDVFLALDPDREGEAIAAHVAEELKLKKPSRVVFHEVTKDAILDAMSHPRSINSERVDAQKARRVLDRLVGYELSELLWKKIWYGLSAGRVQSVATRLIVEREREIEAFVPREFWELFAHLSTKKNSDFTAKFAKIAGKTFVPSSKAEVDTILDDLEGASWKVGEIVTSEKKKAALPPHTTATLQRSANSYLGYSASRTMQLAQQLYQGVTVKGKGQIGLITYMRTDSMSLSSNAENAIRDYISSAIGKEYVPDKPNRYKTRSKLAQEAHEAIRPTDVTLHPDDVKESITPQQHKLYTLIWNRAVGCQMKPMVYNESIIHIIANGKNDSYLFTLRAREILFDGFAKVVGRGLIKDEGLQEVRGLKEGEVLDCKKIEPHQKFTKPRSRYTEASLVKTLEKYGIGRPSTYATIISTIQNRGYVGREGRYLFPTDVGLVVTDFLTEHFSTIVDYDFTSSVEENLDEIALGDKEWVPVVKEVYVPFHKTLEQKGKTVKKEDVVILGDSTYTCPECSGKMVERLGRDGIFLSCASFPECRGMLGKDGKTLAETVDKKRYVIEKICKECGAEMQVKRGKFGLFWACAQYPECKNTEPMKLLEKCPECDSNLVERKGKWGKTFIGCSGYPKCRYIQKQKKETGTSDGDT